MNKLLPLVTGFAVAAGIFHLTGLSDARVSQASAANFAVASLGDRDSFTSPYGEKPVVLREFAVGSHNWLPGHRGVDLAVPVGATVLAAGDGTVIYAGRLNDRSLVSIEHNDGIRTTYEPVLAVVSVGDRVNRGEIIGTLDSGHCMFESCLHWGAKRGSDGYFNPMSLLAGPIRLVE